MGSFKVGVDLCRLSFEQMIPSHVLDTIEATIQSET